MKVTQYESISASKQLKDILNLLRLKQESYGKFKIEIKKEKDKLLDYKQLFIVITIISWFLKGYIENNPKVRKITLLNMQKQ